MKEDLAKTLSPGVANQPKIPCAHFGRDHIEFNSGLSPGRLLGFQIPKDLSHRRLWAHFTLLTSTANLAAIFPNFRYKCAVEFLLKKVVVLEIPIEKNCSAQADAGVACPIALPQPALWSFDWLVDQIVLATPGGGVMLPAVPDTFVVGLGQTEMAHGCLRVRVAADEVRLRVDWWNNAGAQVIGGLAVLSEGERDDVS